MQVAPAVFPQAVQVVHHQVFLQVLNLQATFLNVHLAAHHLFHPATCHAHFLAHLHLKALLAALLQFTLLLALA